MPESEYRKKEVKTDTPIPDTPIPASVQYIYKMLASCNDKICTLERKLEFIVTGKGDFPEDNGEYPLQVSPSMPTIKNIAFDIEQKINLCTQLVNVLRDGGHLK